MSDDKCQIPFSNVETIHRGHIVMYYLRVVMTLDQCFQINLPAALQRLPGPQGEKSVLLFEHGSMVIKLYAPRGTDEQMPHSQDELYVVAQGTGEFVCAGTRQPFGPHDVLFAAAGVEHRFENFSDDFAVWVFFYGPEGGEVDRS